MKIVVSSFDQRPKVSSRSRCYLLLFPSFINEEIDRVFFTASDSFFDRKKGPNVLRFVTPISPIF
jgi:hypothetical protein